MHISKGHLHCTCFHHVFCAKNEPGPTFNRCFLPPQKHAENSHPMPLILSGFTTPPNWNPWSIHQWFAHFLAFGEGPSFERPTSHLFLFFVVSFCKTSKRWLIPSWGRHKIAPTKMADNKKCCKMAGTKMADNKNLCRSCSSPPSLHCGYDNLRMSCLVPSQKRHGKGRSSQGTARGGPKMYQFVLEKCVKRCGF